MGSGLQEKFIKSIGKRPLFDFGNRWIKTTGLEREKLVAVLESQDILQGTGNKQIL